MPMMKSTFICAKQNKPMKNSKKILFSLALFFIGCLSYLAYIEKQQQDYNYGKSWWTIYFINPQEKELSFVIENHSSQKNFHWEILAGKDRLSQGDVTAALGEKKTINVQAPQNIANQQVIIKISTPKDSKEIYKNL
jgi:hypothetical protein